MPQQEVYTDRITTTLAATISASDLTVTPQSYAISGLPASGRGDITIFRPVVGASEAINVEVLTVTDFSVHPWPVLRGQSHTAATSHQAGDQIDITTLTARTIHALTDTPRAAAALYLAATCI